MSEWSVEARALVRPARVYRDLASHDGQELGALRRVLLLALTIGCLVSALASGRLSLRLIADGAVSFAFIPIVEVAAFGVVALTGVRRRAPWASSASVFFVGHAPWLVWMAFLTVLAAVVPPRVAPAWASTALVATAVPAFLSARLDYHFFREVMDRSSRGAIRDVVLYRAMAWSLATAYFFGIAIRWEILPDVIGWLGL
jgi:hypothetical protein